MAIYTELFSEYLETGGELPNVFDLIEGFEDLFKGYFIDKEIGSETETLFAIKLETYANLFVPIYAQRIEDLATAITGARNPIKIWYDTNNTTITNGAQKSKTTELPINSSTAEPNAIAEAEAYTNQNASINQREEKGVSVNEAYYIIDKLNSQVEVLTLKLLKEFEPIFMKVY